MSNAFILDRRAPRSGDLVQFMNLRGHPFIDVQPNEDLRALAGRLTASLRGQKINRLTLVAHGYPGQLLLGEGLTEHNAHELAALHGQMRGPLSSVWCFACMAGAGAAPDADHPDAALHSGWGAAGSAASITYGPGYRMLRALARALGCRAHAPVETQHLRPHTDYDRLLLGEAFTGAMLVVGPAGDFQVEYPDGSARDGASLA